MARKTRKRPAPAAGTRHYQARHVLLAGLGAVSLGRKQVIAAYENGFEGIADIRAAAGTSVNRAVRQAGKAVSGKLVALRRQAAPVQKTIEGIARDARARIRKGLAPALSRFGVKQTAAKRSPARKQPAARRRKAA